MNPPVTGSEALLTEVLGDMVDVLDRADELLPALIRSERRMLDAQAKLTEQLMAIDTRVAALSTAAIDHVVKHINRHGDQATRRSIELHLRAMEEAAQALFVKEVRPALRGLVEPLLHAEAVIRGIGRPWERWLIHAATVCVAALVSALLTFVFLRG